MINLRINDDLVLIMISDQDNQASTRFQDEKMLKFKSLENLMVSIKKSKNP